MISISTIYAIGIALVTIAVLLLINLIAVGASLHAQNEGVKLAAVISFFTNFMFLVAIVVLGTLTCWYIHKNRDALEGMYVWQSLNKTTTQDWHTVADTVFRYPASVQNPNQKLDALLKSQWTYIRPLLRTISSSAINNKIRVLAASKVPPPIDQVFKSLGLA